MYGAVPGVFRNPNAAAKVAVGYAEEEGNKWLVMIKDCDGVDWYNVCRESDIEQSKSEGYKPYVS